MTQILNKPEIHASLLSMLEVVTHVCKTEGIEYFMVGGACLGIVRHDHELIPWDYDVDIAIWAGDMPKFVAACSRLPSPLVLVMKRQPFNPGAKIIDSSTRIIREPGSTSPPETPDGIFVDVVPMMHWPSLAWIRLNDVVAYLVGITHSTTPSSTRWKHGVKMLLRGSGIGWLVRLLARHLLEPIIVRLDRRCREESGTGFISGPFGRRWVVRCRRNIVFPVRPTRLGRLTVDAPSDIRTYLSLRYGPDYMRVPEAGERRAYFDVAERV